MKYVITGGAGHISKPLAEKLLAAQHEVVVISRNAQNLEGLKSKGATAAIGTIEDRDFLTACFEGADAVYTMVPPFLGAPDWKEYIRSIGANYAAAIRNANVKYVVNLSSVGADQPAGCGPVTGLFRAEQELNQLKNVNIMHLRPGYFFNNLLSNIEMVRNMNIIGANFGKGDVQMVLSAPADIATSAADILLHLKFSGHSSKYLVSDLQPVSAIAKQLGSATGNPALPWVTFTDQQMQEGLLKAGLPLEAADNYVEMGTAIESGIFFSDFHKNKPEQFGNTRLEDFAKVFAAAYFGK